MTFVSTLEIDNPKGEMEAENLTALDILKDFIPYCLERAVVIQQLWVPYIFSLHSVYNIIIDMTFLIETLGTKHIRNFLV